MTNVFVLGQRFDFASFGGLDHVRAKSSLDERGRPVSLDTIGNSRMTVGLFGIGFIEVLARQMTSDLQAIRNSTAPGQSRSLVSKRVSFGVISRDAEGEWNTSRVEGLPAGSLASSGPHDPPSLIICPFHQAGRVASIREFSSNAFNQHHGIQPEERVGIGADPDGDGFTNELTRADVTAVVLFQAAMPVPVQVTPKDSRARKAAAMGRSEFEEIGCAMCHVPALPLDRKGWIFTEPGPYNPKMNARAVDTPPISMDLTSKALPGPRLKPDSHGVVWVPAYTDMKLHDITSGPDDPNAEPLDMQQQPGSPEFFRPNRRFITRRLWGSGNTPPYFHHGQFTTMREAILAHSGEALESRLQFERLTGYERDCVIEFLKTLQVLPNYSVRAR